MSHRAADTKDNVRTGKLVGGALYLHRSAIHTLSSSEADLVSEAASLLPNGFEWCVLKVNRRKGNHVSFLDYEDLDHAAFPGLKRSCLVDLSSGKAKVRNYSSDNPPILHRKELLLAFDDLKRKEYAQLTDRLERLGLFQNMHKMGYRKQWEKVLRENGLDSNGDHSE
ncbi:hypothetical protein [Ruegeria sp. HKCCD7319]|nr:hypothetical protein [Ruegeria sp. HKCCD7319]NOD36644.1 hypothetical protein [Ruegeria sp. HKCCD7296]NOE43857.1 hypothetical protein [Ruegeria sp. HKCCD7319]